MEKILTIEKLHELMHYNPETGSFKRRIKLSNRTNLEKDVGFVGGNGRRYVTVYGKHYLAHRLAWFYMTGFWPTNNIAAIDGNYLNVRFANLKEETPTETVMKSGIRSTNTSGIKGVSWDKVKNKWLATKTKDYKQVFLGYFDSKEDAAKAISETTNIQVSPEERQKNSNKIRTRIRQKRLWKSTLNKFDGLTDWPSFEAFCESVGTHSCFNHEIVKVDNTKPIGPNNFAWSSLIEKNLNINVIQRSLAYSRQHRKDNPNHYREKHLKKKFGIDILEYQKLLDKQNGVCRICKQPETAIRKGKLQPLAVDHNHTTGEIRGLLCNNCNIGIGNFKDDESLLFSAIAYLQESKKVTNEV